MLIVISSKRQANRTGTTADNVMGFLAVLDPGTVETVVLRQKIYFSSPVKTGSKAFNSGLIEWFLTSFSLMVSRIFPM